MSDKTETRLMPGETPADIAPLARPFLFLGSQRTKDLFIWVPIVGTLASIAFGFVYHHKDPAPWDFFASWALWGFLSYTFVVLSAGPLFRLLSRREDYYGEGSVEEVPHE